MMSSHRVGSITFGMVLVVFGLLFLINAFLPGLSYHFIFRLWPLTLIGLGIELLLSNVKYKERFVYDWAAVLLMMLLLAFSMTMAGIETFWQYHMG